MKMDFFKADTTKLTVKDINHERTVLFFISASSFIVMLIGYVAAFFFEPMLLVGYIANLVCLFSFIGYCLTFSGEKDDPLESLE
jgi:hypothetical protein